MAQLPDVELHVDIPDTMLPFRNVTDHVFDVGCELSGPLPDGSKIMAMHIKKPPNGRYLFMVDAQGLEPWTH